jgi:hypothetical protein
MHEKGPVACVLSLVRARVRTRVSAARCSEGGASWASVVRGGAARVQADDVQTTAEFHKLSDIPSRALAYNFLICSHAVCEALTVLTRGRLIPRSPWPHL